MLVIERQIGQSFVVHTPSGDVRVMVTGISGRRATIGIDAPKEWSIERDNIQHTKAEAAGVSYTPTAS